MPRANTGGGWRTREFRAVSAPGLKAFGADRLIPEREAPRPTQGQPLLELVRPFSETDRHPVLRRRNRLLE